MFYLLYLGCRNYLCVIFTFLHAFTLHLAYSGHSFRQLDISGFHFKRAELNFGSQQSCHSCVYCFVCHLDNNWMVLVRLPWRGARQKSCSSRNTVVTWQRCAYLALVNIVVKDLPSLHWPPILEQTPTTKTIYASPISDAFYIV